MNSIAAVVFFAVVAAVSAGNLGLSGLVASTYTAPAFAAYSAPLAYNAPLAYSAHLAAPAYTAYTAPLAYSALGQAAESTVVAGPSGTITKNVATPSIAARYAIPSAYGYGGLYL